MISQVLRVVCYIVCGESVEMIKEFFYLVSTISYGDEIKIHFGCLKKSIFTNSYLSIAVAISNGLTMFLIINQLHFVKGG